MGTRFLNVPNFQSFKGRKRDQKEDICHSYDRILTRMELESLCESERANEAVQLFKEGVLLNNKRGTEVIVSLVDGSTHIPRVHPASQGDIANRLSSLK